MASAERPPGPGVNLNKIPCQYCASRRRVPYKLPLRVQDYGGKMPSVGAFS